MVARPINAAALRARRLFFWAAGLCIVFWLIPLILTLVPVAAAQTTGVLMVWVGVLPTVVLAISAIVFGAIGLGRSRALHGAGRKDALTGLIGGIGVFVAPAVLLFIVIVIAFVGFGLVSQ